MKSLELAKESTALVLIDLQYGVVSRQTSPYSPADVVSRSVRLADKFRELGAPIVLVRVAFSPDLRDRLSVPVDAPIPASSAAPSSNWSEIVSELGPKDGDLVVTKRQWGAFYGTDLDLQLRRRGVRSIVLAGIATNFGVESTARDAYERGYHQVFVEDAMTSLGEGAHQFVVDSIFPRMGQVRSTDEVLQAFNS